MTNKTRSNIGMVAARAGGVGKRCPGGGGCHLQQHESGDAGQPTRPDGGRRQHFTAPLRSLGFAGWIDGPQHYESDSAGVCQPGGDCRHDAGCTSGVRLERIVGRAFRDTGNRHADRRGCCGEPGRRVRHLRRDFGGAGVDQCPGSNFGLALSSSGLFYLDSKENTSRSHAATLDVTLAVARAGEIFVQDKLGLNVAAGPYSMPVETSFYNTAFGAETLSSRPQGRTIPRSVFKLFRIRLPAP